MHRVVGCCLLWTKLEPQAVPLSEVGVQGYGVGCASRANVA